MYVESNMETYVTKCKIDSQWEFAVWLREPERRASICLKEKKGVWINMRTGLKLKQGIRMPSIQVRGQQN